MKTIIVIKRVMFDGTEIAFDTANSFNDASIKLNAHLKAGHKVNAYELTGTELLRLAI